jgi:hypothetical protein
MFGIREKALFAMLKASRFVRIIPSGYHEEVLFVAVPAALYRTFKTDDLLRRYPMTDIPRLVTETQEQWAKLEALPALARLSVSNDKREMDSGKNARLLVAEDEASVYVEQAYLDVFADCASLLSNFLFESIDYRDKSVGECPVRVSMGKGNTVAYIMPSHVQKKVW